MIGEMGTKRECDLQNALDESYAQRRQDKVELHKAQNEIKRLQNLLSEHKIMIRQEKNATKILELENEAMLKHTAMERDNMYKMQQIKALNTVTMNAVSPRQNYALDLKRKSKSLTKTLTKSKNQAMSATGYLDLDSDNSEDLEKTKNDFMTHYQTAKLRRSVAKSPSYQDKLKENIKRKVSVNNRYEIHVDSPSNRANDKRKLGAYQEAERFLKKTEQEHNAQISTIPNVN